MTRTHEHPVGQPDAGGFAPVVRGMRAPVLGFQLYSSHLGDYMRRWVLRVPGGRALRVHHIRRPDKDAELHDHPFAFWSLVLWGWYREERPAAGESPTPGGGRVHRIRVAGDLDRLGAAEPHRITHVHPRGCWTLVLTTRRVREWGFWTAGGWTHWREFASVKG